MTSQAEALKCRPFTCLESLGSTQGPSHRQLLTGSGFLSPQQNRKGRLEGKKGREADRAKAEQREEEESPHSCPRL